MSLIGSGTGAGRAAGDLEPSADLRGGRERMLAVAHRERRVPHYRSLVMHWLGRWLRQPRPARIEPLPAVEPGQVGISFAGHASVLIRYASLTIACDPMLGTWVKGVKRAVEPGLAPADLHDVDLILISHGHADHLHRKTLAALPRSATVIVPPRTAHRVSDLGFARVMELEVGQSFQHRDVEVITTPARHGDQNDLRALSYMIRGKGPSVFFCGDSGYFSGFADIGQRLRPDIAILPVGGYWPLSFRERHMSPLDALHALEDLGARLMIPIHHGSFALSYERLNEPSEWLGELVRERALQGFVIELEPGESRVFVPPRSQTQDQASTATTIGKAGPDDNRDEPLDREHEPTFVPKTRHPSLPPRPTRRDMHHLPALSAALHLRGQTAALERPVAGLLAGADEPAPVPISIDLFIDAIWDEAAAPG